VCGAHVYVCCARACARACTRVRRGTEYPYQRGDAIPATVLQRRTSRAHTPGVGRWGGGRGGRGGDWCTIGCASASGTGSPLLPPPSSLPPTVTTTAGTSTRFSPSFSRRNPRARPSLFHALFRRYPTHPSASSPLFSLSLSLSLSLFPFPFFPSPFFFSCA